MSDAGTPRLRVLLIEDELVDAELVRRCLVATERPGFRLEHARTLQQGLDRLGKGDVDVVLLDLNLPDSRGIDTVVRLRERDAAVPVVVFTVIGDEEAGAAALAAGAQDYVVKDVLTHALLVRSLRHAIERRRIAEQGQLREDRMRRAEKMQLLGAFAGGIGFGLNGLIGTILDRCDTAAASLDSPRRGLRLRTALLEIHRAAFRAAEMVQRMRDYSARERGASREVDLASFVVDAADFLATMVPPRVELACESAGGALRVEIERPELHRLLASLVVNAAEALGEEGGSISLATGRRRVDAATLARSHGWPDAEPGLYAFLRVADTGPGLDAALHERVFDPFYTTKLAGRGLGLASVLGILHRHRAVVLVDGNHPTGTVFTVLFPLKR